MKRRFWLLFLIVLVVFCSFLYKTFYDEAKERAINSLNERQRLHARQASLGIEDYLTNLTISLNSISQSEDIAILNLSGKKLIQAFYESNKERFQTFTRMDSNGRIIYSIPNKKVIGNDISAQKHVREVMSSHKPVVSDVFRAVQGLDVVALHVPVFNKGRYDGTIAIGINFQVIAQRYLEGIHIGETGYAWMISRDGTELYCPIPGHTGKTVFENCKDFPSILAMAEEMVKGREGVTTYVFDRVRGQVVEAVRKHAVYIPVKVGNTFWSIVVASSEEEVLSSLANFRNRLLWIIGLILLGGGLFSFYGLKAVFIVREEQKRRRVEEALQKSEEQAKQLAQENAMMAEIGRIISSSLNIEEVYKSFSDKVKELIPFDRITIGLINSEEGTHTIPYVDGVVVSERQPGAIVSLTGTTLEKVLKTRKGVFIRMDDENEIAGKFPGLLPDFQSGLRSALTVPLISRDQVIGALALRSTLPGIYTERDLRLAQGIGNQIAGAIANAQLYGRLREIEESLRRSEGKFRELYDSAPVGYHEFDMEGRITNVNRADQEMLGYSRKELIGEYVWKFTLEEDIAHREILEKLAGLRPPGHSFERTYRRKDGMTLPVLLQDRLNTDDQGKVTGMKVAIQDIAEQKRTEKALRESEERYRQLVELSPEAVFVHINGKFVYINPAATRLFNLSAPEEVIGKSIFDFYHPDYHEVIRERSKQIQDKRKPVESIEQKYIRADGQIIDVEVTGAPITYNGEQGVLTVARDISERVRADVEKTTLQEQLRQSQKMEGIGRLAGGIAHDFNNLLTVIKGYSQLSLSELRKGDPLRENIEEIRNAADRAADLTRQLLAFSRRQILEFKTLDLNQLTQDMEKMLRRIIGEDIELMIYPGEDLGSVRTDPGQLEQVIMNLAVNARDAMPSGGKLILETDNVFLDEEYARHHISVKPGSYVRLSITDTGCGMTPEVSEQIFEPFFTTKEIGKGTGLGLSTVYGIVKQSDGNIWVYSESGKGTTFKIYLPRMDEPVEVLIKKGELKDIPRGNETILVVEDEEVVRKLAVQILKKQGYEVLQAAEGGEALLVLEQHSGPIHLILTDVVMPGMSGPQLVERLQQVRKDFKVIYMSGYTDESVIYHGVQDGETNFMQKPFTLEMVGTKVREVLDEVIRE
jgi:PAS domain S-box-containing protein